MLVCRTVVSIFDLSDWIALRRNLGLGRGVYVGSKMTAAYAAA
jgi:hypothetical protein